MILLDQHIDANRKDVGEKALNLRRLQEAGFLVPKFVVIPAEVISKLWSEKNVKTASEMIHVLLQSHHYAVRSSALIEDQEKSSMAGIYKTRLAVTSEHLESSLEEVLLDASEKMNGNLKDFALIIQEFVEPDRSGVVFTRSPDGHPSLVLESVKGRGERLVGGEVTPRLERFLWSAVPDEYRDFQRIEALWGFPQDVEWCEAQGKRYYLQTRPITTLSSASYASMKKLDQVLPSERDFWYEKTDLSAAVPRPSEAMLTLLERIYGEAGPVQKVYGKYRMQYQPSVFWKSILGELYVDREAEMRTLFPAYGLKSSNEKNGITFRLKSFKGLLKTLQNQFFLQKLPIDDHEFVFESLQKLLQERFETSSLEASLRDFLNAYEVVFEINLKTTKAFEHFKNVLGRHSGFFQELLSSRRFPEEIVFPSLDVLDASAWKGNGLDLSDDSIFSASESPRTISDELLSWWKGLSDVRRSWVLSHLQRVRRWQELREYARWLTVKHMNQLRKFFSDSLMESHALSLPRVLTNLVGLQGPSSQTVSGGSARGVFVTVDSLPSLPRDLILYSPLLSPSLAQYLPSIKGIIAEQGGMLSHVAILARERNIPVLVGVPFSEAREAFGKSIHLDGEKGTWTVLES
ncbi:MAG: PEP/pyruvate-binding domain-containing protein [Candidatus Altimarinota bacterium]